MRCFFVLILLGIATLAPAAEVVWEECNQTLKEGAYATARLIGDMGGGMRSVASCVIIEYREDTGMAVACAHQAREERAWYVWPVYHEQMYQATLVHKLRESYTWSADLAVFTFRPTEPVYVAKLAERSPPIGTPAQIRGFPLGTTRQQAKDYRVSAVGSQSISMSGPAQQGDSGGAVFDRSTGELIGIVSCTSPYDSMATNVETLRDMLTRHTQWGRSPGGSSSPSPSISDLPSPQQRTPIQRGDVPITPSQTPRCNIDYDKLLEMLAADERFKPKTGPRGPQGPPGETVVGPPGPAGADGANGTDGISVSVEQVRQMVREEMPEVNLDEVAKQVEERLPPIYIPNQDASGNTVRREIRLGDTLPPLHIRKGIKNPDGSYGEIVSETPVYLGESATFWYFPNEEQKLHKE